MITNTAISRPGFMLALLSTLASPAFASADAEPSGQDLAFNNRMGNCLACHAIPGDAKAVTSTNIAPPLISMKERFPDRRKLYDQIFDATRVNSNSAMPPFGKHGVLSDGEINKIIDYLYGL